MRESRFTESQIVSIWKDGDEGIPLADLVRKHGISRATYFNWKSLVAPTVLETVRRGSTSS
jgi:putative transposase